MRWLSIGVLFTVGLLGELRVTSSQDAAAPKKEDEALVERGRYLALHVAQCVQCHSPRDEHGEIEPLHLFEGAAIPLTAPYEGMRWAFHAPRIRGLPGYTTEQAVRLLTTGVRANGGTPSAPMPPFRMTEDDARAVTAYLLSIGGRDGG
jgi:mono/diheme cytochrome c family protein